MELIGVLGRRRLEREFQRREAALREAAQTPHEQEPVALPAQEPEPEPRPLLAQPEAAQTPHEQELVPLPAQEPEPRPLLAREVPRMPEQWKCEFCGHSFHGYGSYLNHRCDSDTQPRS